MGMLSWMITNYKATIAIFTALLTSVAVPLWIFSVGMIVKIDTTSATVSANHEPRIINLEKAWYANEERSKRMEKILERIEERDFQELKQARQQRLATKP